MPDEDLSVRQQMNGGLVRGGAGNRTQLVEYNATVALASFRTLHTRPAEDFGMKTGFVRSWLVLASPWLAACASSPRSYGEPEAASQSPDQAWVATACQPVAVDTTGWRRLRTGDLTLQVPQQYTPLAPRPSNYGINSGGYDLAVRGSGGSLLLQLHRNARYTFDGFNRARRGQNWCNGSLGGHQAEILAWFEPFAGNRRDTFAGELIIGATYNFVARFPATWGGQDEGKWVFVRVGASRLQDAQALRDALHTLSAVKP